MKKVFEAAKKIKLFVTDVDGVLTNGLLGFDDQGRELKQFHVQDGFGFELLMKYGIQTGIISGRNTPIVQQRANDLKIQHIYQGCKDKRIALQDLLEKLQLQPEQVAYVGDDLLDLPLIKYVGLGIAVRNAHPWVRQHALWQTLAAGGKGAVRECCDLILRAQNHFDELVEHYSRWLR